MDTIVHASLWHLVVASVVGALVLHLIVFPILRLTLRLVPVIVFVTTTTLFFGGLIYIQQHTKLPSERYKWVQRFDGWGENIFFS
jgi:hypothetical protein